MWELEHQEVCASKNWYSWTVVLEKTLESRLDCKEIKWVNPKGNQSWIFTGSTDAEAQAPIFWPPDKKSWLVKKRPWCWERLKARGEGDNRGWDGWMASPTRWTWVWASSRIWLGVGKPGMLQSLQSLRIRYNWVTEQQMSYLGSFKSSKIVSSLSGIPSAWGKYKVLSTWASHLSLVSLSY